MDIRTGHEYDTKEAALANGVPLSDIAHIEKRDGDIVVKFSKGSFKNYRRENGSLVLVSK